MFSTREITQEDQDLEHQSHPGASVSLQHRRGDISSFSKVPTSANPFLPLSSPHLLTFGSVSPLFSLSNLPCLAPFCSFRYLGIYSDSRSGLPSHISTSSISPASLSLSPANSHSLSSLVRSQLSNHFAPSCYSRHPGSFSALCSDLHTKISSKPVAFGFPTYPPASFYSPCFSDILPRVALIIPPQNAFNSYTCKVSVPNHFISLFLLPSMAHSEDCFHCADLQAELEEIRAQQSILDDKQKLLDSRLEEHDRRLDEQSRRIYEQERIMTEKYKAEIQLFMHKAASLQEQFRQVINRCAHAEESISILKFMMEKKNSIATSSSSVKQEKDDHPEESTARHIQHIMID